MSRRPLYPTWRTIRATLAVLRFSLLLVLLPSVAQRRIEAQQVPVPSDRPAEVYRERIVVRLPRPFQSESLPEPAVRGYFAWKVSFGGDPEATIVFRTDSAISIKSRKQVVSAAALYMCPPGEILIQACTIRAAGSARLTSEALLVEITEAAIVTRVKARRPDAAFRQIFEPGGRFKADYVLVRYSASIK